MEFGLYSLEQKSVQKYKISFKINTCAWSTDGQTLALGCDNGCISLRNRCGEEVANIELSDGQSVWAITWLSSKYLLKLIILHYICICYIYMHIVTCRYYEDEILCIADWGQKLSFYNKNGSEVIN